MTDFTKADISAAYSDLKLKSGWTFLYCPATRIQTAEIAIVGLNPGGRDDAGSYDEIWECESNAYLDERWGPDNSRTPLQYQIQQWHQLAGVDGDQTLCVQYVPFRSKDWQGLANQDEVLRFAERLWAWFATVAHARTFITMGRIAGDGVARAIGCDQEPIFLETGWGQQTISVRKTSNGRRVITMPHPSRYRLFGRSNGQSEQAEESFRRALSL